MEDISGAYSHYPPPPFSSYYRPPPPPPPGAASAYDYYPPPPPQGVGAALPPYHHHQPPPPPPSHYSLPPLHPPSLSASHHHLEPSSSDEVRTLFVAGLPGDVQAREIYNLFREFPGFESSQLRGAGSTRAYAFAVFIDQQSAVTAMQSLNGGGTRIFLDGGGQQSGEGLMFDLEKESSLFIDLAKSNSRSKRSRTDNGMSYSPDKKFRATVGYSRGFLDSGVGSNIHMPGMGNSAYSINGYPSTQSYAIYDYGATDPNKSLNSSSTNYIPQKSNPCSTLFVANLGPTCSEQELTDVFSRCPGFSKLKMQKKNGLPVAFIDFKNVASSTGALNYLQGTLLSSSVGEGMRLEYAKSRMGQPGREKRT